MRSSRKKEKDNNKITKNIISNPIIQELINTYTIIINDDTKDDTKLSNLPKAKLKESASWVTLLVISPLDFSSNATDGKSIVFL